MCIRDRIPHCCRTCRSSGLQALDSFSTWDRLHEASIWFTSQYVTWGASGRTWGGAVSYTHLRAHETSAHL
eukprot:8145525-Alexandrium_andersonii.AAC.1